MSELPKSEFDLARIHREARVSAVEYHDEIASTNTRALDAVASGKLTSPPRPLVLPLLVLANRQSAGRGRGQNQWWAGTGSLTFSFVIEGSSVELSQREWPLISLATGLAVAETIETVVSAGDVQLKWPNDVLLAGRKVSGILVETSPQRAGAIVVGVGVNVNNSFRDAPRDLQSVGISLSDFVGRTIDRTEILIGILGRMSDQLERLARDRSQLADNWRQRCFLQGRTVQLNSGGQTMAGVCQGIDEGGALLLHTEVGIQRCYGGVVTRIL